MKELIERLEKTAGPDFDLDHQIGLATRLFRDWHRPYTSSIDAALTLVPRGLPWQISSDQVSGALASVCTLKNDNQHIDQTVRASGPLSAPAIALCIAALKAREALAHSPAAITDQ
jgi:hypothetical protein